MLLCRPMIPNLRKQILTSFIRNGLLLGTAASIILFYIAKKCKVSFQDSLLLVIFVLVVILLFLILFYFYLKRKLLLPINKAYKLLYERLTKKDSLNELDSLIDLYNYIPSEVLEKLKEIEEKEKSIVSSQEDLKFTIEEKNKALKMLTNNISGITNKLEEVNKEFNEFVYITSHDLKEPLRSIEAFSKFLYDDYEHLMDKKGKEYLKILIEATQKMKIRISILWELAKLSSEEYSYEEFSLREIIDNSLLDIKELTNKKKLNISYNNIDTKAYGNPAMIKKVLSNLITNGIKFNDKKEINLEIGSINGKDALTVYVKDNGVGIRDLYYEKVFHIFQRLNPESNHEDNGAGLTICKKIINKHKGNIWLESKINEGSTFYFTLPHKKS
ncbi:MAG: ATP-binding protein [bacterium]|nr:ATP-binding protein [bacterium]